MGRYMPQQLFDMCAVSAAKISALSGEPIESVAEQLANTYQRDYQDENLSQDISAAASNVKTLVVKFLSEEALAARLTQFQFCIKHYKSDGKKRPFRLGGTFFNREKQQLPDKVATCLSDVAAYYFLVTGGAIRIAPEGWRL
jgi:hypothetical protein